MNGTMDDSGKLIAIIGDEVCAENSERVVTIVKRTD